MALNASVPRRHKGALTPGDLLAIPAPCGGCFLAVHITANRFGDAYGVLAGRHTLQPPPLDFHPAPLCYPMYSGREFVLDGRWRRLGNHPALLGLFPSEPEIFHTKAGYNQANPLIGPFGSGESAEGSLRSLSEGEATELGLLTGTYKQILLEEEIETLLCRTVADSNAQPGAA